MRKQETNQKRGEKGRRKEDRRKRDKDKKAA
jgi:hypothetical protein